MDATRPAKPQYWPVLARTWGKEQTGSFLKIMPCEPRLVGTSDHLYGVSGVIGVPMSMYGNPHHPQSLQTHFAFYTFLHESWCCRNQLRSVSKNRLPSAESSSSLRGDLPEKKKLTTFLSKIENMVNLWLIYGLYMVYIQNGCSQGCCFPSLKQRKHCNLQYILRHIASKSR